MIEKTKISLTGKLREALGNRDDLYLYGDSLATEEQFRTHAVSVAVVVTGGAVWRHFECVGSLDDISIDGPKELVSSYL